jgi:hypothetical protein
MQEVRDGKCGGRQGLAPAGGGRFCRPAQFFGYDLKTLIFPTAPNMSQKRKHTDAAEGASDAPHFKKQRSFKPRGGGRGQSTSGRGRRPADSDESKADSTSSLKSRIRNLTRLLEHLDKDAKNKVPANVRNERERELEACKHELAEKLAADREQDFRNKIIGKYHHIRFFGTSQEARAAPQGGQMLTVCRAPKGYADCQTPHEAAFRSGRQFGKSCPTKQDSQRRR